MNIKETNKEEAKAFASWIVLNGYYAVYEDRMWQDKDRNSIAKDLDELYNLFKSQS